MFDSRDRYAGASSFLRGTIRLYRERMPGRSDEVTVKFVRDFADSAGSLRFAAGTQHVVDAASASALVLAGVAVKLGQILPE